MKKETQLTVSGQQYADAYEKHYGQKDQHGALLAYKGIVTEHPDSREAGYSRSQIQNIMRNVVPGDILYNNELNLALSYATDPEAVLSA